MNKIVAGLLFGLILGVLDGATAWFYPETRGFVGGMMVGLLAGWFAQKVQSTLWGVVVGSALGLLFAYGVAAMQKDHYLEIMLPGFLVGAIVGFLTQRVGQTLSSANQ